MKYKAIKWITILLQLGLLGVLFVPFLHDYELSSSLWNLILEGYRTGDLESILAFMLYYIPVIIGLLLVALLESRIRYGFALLSAGLGFSFTLTRYLFPALVNGYQFAIYQAGLYILLALQCATILFCLIGICMKDELPPYFTKSSVNPNIDTAEIDLPHSIKKSKKGAKHMA